MKTLCIDFDGVISKYEKYLGKGVFGDPVDGAPEMLRKLKAEGWVIIIHTTRSEEHALIYYFQKHNIPFDYINFNPTNEKLKLSSKPIADVYLDDRAVCFDGNWDEAYKRIINFKPWYKEKNDESF